MMIINRERISQDLEGRTIKSFTWEAEGGGYWVLTFDNKEGREVEICVRLMAEIVAGIYE